MFVDFQLRFDCGSDGEKRSEMLYEDGGMPETIEKSVLVWQVFSGEGENFWNCAQTSRLSMQERPR